MVEYIKLNITSNMGNDQIRQIAKNAMNGEYTTVICKRCGMYWQSIDGNWKTATIQDGCSHCHIFPTILD